MYELGSMYENDFMSRTECHDTIPVVCTSTVVVYVFENALLLSRFKLYFDQK